MSDTPAKAPGWLLWSPLLIFAAFVALVAVGLFRPADREVRSALIGKPLPEFDLRPSIPGQPGLKTADFKDGKPRLLNIFASWCVPCAAEAPQLLALRQAGVKIDGVAIRDRSEDVQRFLARHGNPYDRIGADDVSAVQFALGSSGVPESFIVDGQGVIRYQHIGDIRPDQVEMILARLKEAGL